MDNDACIACTNSSIATPTLIVFLVILFIVIVAGVIFAWYYYFVLIPWEMNENLVGRPRSVKIDKSLLNLTASLSDKDNKTNKRISTNYLLYLTIESFVQEHKDRLTVVVKILIATFQIITAASSYSKKSLPLAFSRFMQGLNAINFNVVSILPLNCTQSVRYSYIDTLYLITLGPIILSASIFIAFIVSYYHARRKIQSNNNRKKGDKTKKFNDLRSRYLSYFFYLM
jgi:hypothetical protein